jgi:hypothetical protein
MRHLVRSGVAATVACLGLTTGALAQTADRCTHDVLTVDGTAVSATFCVAAPAARQIVVTETFARADQSFSRPLAIDVVDGATVTRAIDDVALSPFGSPKRLHLTIAYQGATATLEHALLLPGAVVLK